MQIRPIATLLVLLAAAGGAQPLTLNRAAPLLLVDTGGRTAGRLAGTVNNGGYELAMVVLQVGSATTAVLAAPWSTTAGPKPGLYWAPTLRTQVYYASADCSGPPVVTAPTLALGFGMRWSVVDFAGSSRQLHLGANVPPSLQPARSFRFWDFYAPSPSGFSASPCTGGIDGVIGVPTETVVDLDAAWPAPLWVR